ncbi:hypothetical protein GCM10020229_13360 [Kitasatospora albolonga]
MGWVPNPTELELMTTPDRGTRPGWSWPVPRPEEADEDPLRTLGSCVPYTFLTRLLMTMAGRFTAWIETDAFPTRPADDDREV